DPTLIFGELAGDAYFLKYHRERRHPRVLARLGDSSKRSRSRIFHSGELDLSAGNESRFDHHWRRDGHRRRGRLGAADRQQPQPLYFRSTETGLYAQDEIKLKPNFSLRLGVREEMTSGWNEAQGHAANYVYDANGIVQTDPRIDSSAFLKNNARMLWEPRVGL